MIFIDNQQDFLESALLERAARLTLGISALRHGEPRHLRRTPVQVSETNRQGGAALNPSLKPFDQTQGKPDSASTSAPLSASSDITIVLTDDAQLHELNRDYLGVDAPTDVLSFPASELDPETGSTYLGDILISIPRATQQAQAAGHPIEAEVQLLVVHGVLHLLGYDHAEAQEKARMWAEQAKVLERLGLGHIKIQYSE